MHFAHDLGIRVMLSEFSPIPGTPDGERCRRWVDLDEPLCHNKTAFCLRFLGDERVNRLKSLCRDLNQSIGLAACRFAPADAARTRNDKQPDRVKAPACWELNT